MSTDESVLTVLDCGPGRWMGAAQHMHQQNKQTLSSIYQDKRFPSIIIPSNTTTTF